MDSSIPVKTSLPEGKKASTVSVGDDHACSVMEDGTLYCWGGSWSWGDEYGSTPEQITLPSGKSASKVVASKEYSCAIMDDGSLYCWGDNSVGQLGDGTWSDSSSLVQTDIPSGRTAIDVSGTYMTTCAVLDDGSVYCWGENGFSQIGDGTTTDSNTPVHYTPAGRSTTAVSSRLHSRHC